MRILIWATLIAQALWIGLSALNGNEERINNEAWVPGGLWPGDWVPHPNMPEPNLPQPGGDEA